jgi:hypothetical protein
VRLADAAGTFTVERPVRFVGPDRQLLDADSSVKAPVENP